MLIQYLKQIKQIIEGVSELHEHIILHRDLKPGNIFLSED